MGLKIGKVYKTSKGTFWKHSDACRNRAFIPETMRDPPSHEPVEEVFVLINDETNQSYLLGSAVKIN